MREPLVSVVIPAYNAEAYVGAAVESALAQTHAHLEVVVVDDGSTDATAAAARAVASARVRVVTQPNRGASAARNAGLGLARGDYIQHLDADDLLDPTKIAAQVSRLAVGSARAVASGAWGRFADDPRSADFRPGPLWHDLAPVDFLCRAYLGHEMMHPATWLVPRQVAAAAGSWDERLSLNDDGEYFARVVLASDGVLFCPESRAYYRSGRAGTLSSLRSRRGQESMLLSLELCAERLVSAEDTPRTRSAAATLMQGFVFDWYPASPDLLARAQALRDALGTADLAPDGPPAFHALRKVVGWRLARRLERFATRYAIGRTALRRRLRVGS